MRNGYDVLHRLVHRVPQFLEIRDDLFTDLQHVHAGIFLIDEIRCLDQLGLRIVPVEMQDTVLHFAVIDHQDHQHPVVGQGQEFDLPQRGLLTAGHRDDTGKTRYLREHPGNGTDQRFGIVDVLPQI